MCSSKFTGVNIRKKQIPDLSLYYLTGIPGQRKRETASLALFTICPYLTAMTGDKLLTKN